MLEPLFRLLAAQVLAGLLLATSAHAEPARVQLAAYRVQTVMQDGVQKERLQSLEHIRPGDVVDYEATYSNVGTALVTQVVLTVPVPDGGLVYIEGGARPLATWASLDGKVFGPMPLMRPQTLPDGRRVMRRVPPAEIRFLRWDLGDIQAGASRIVRARMQMPALQLSAR